MAKHVPVVLALLVASTSLISIDAIRGTSDDMEEGTFAVAGKCKRWCKTMDWFAIKGLEGDLDAVKKHANEKCVKNICKGCKGDGATVPCCTGACLEPVPEPSPTEEEVVLAEPNDGPAKDGEVCKHVTTPWCMAPSRNPGHKYRKNGKPLCCFKQEKSNVDTKPEPAPAEPEVEPEPPAPLCADGGNFDVVSMEVAGKKSNLCQDTETGALAARECCDPAAFISLKEKEEAEEACPGVPNKHCKSSPNIFVGKRNKYRGVPNSFACKRMYWCVEKGEEMFGPVPSQSWCTKAKTGLAKNRQAHTVCTAVKLCDGAAGCSS